MSETWGDGNPRIPGETFDEYNARMIDAMNNIPDDRLARHPDGTLNTDPVCLCGTRLGTLTGCPAHYWL